MLESDAVLLSRTLMWPLLSLIIGGAACPDEQLRVEEYYVVSCRVRCGLHRDLHLPTQDVWGAKGQLTTTGGEATSQ